ncbi:MAG: DUF981 domain-containing protein [Candidatus Micrarchaeaceae archaeon]
MLYKAWVKREYMFVDPLAVMLLGVSASAVFIAYYLIAAAKGRRAFSDIALPMFLLGAFDFLSGFYMSFFWPLPGAYNMLFGDPMLMLGVIMLAGGYALYKGISPKPISLLGFLLGIYLFAESYGMYAFSMEPLQDMAVALSFYLVSAVAALLSPLVYITPKKSGKAAYYFLAAVLIIVVILAMLIGVTSIIGHLQAPP